jgi:cell division initiation protein
MRITPLDIRKQEFRKAMRGLDSEEVYAFLTTVAEEYEAALSDNKALRERVLELDDKVQEYRTMERTLRDTLLTAERVTADAKENARREANLIIKEAQIEAEKVLRDIKNQAMKLRQEVQELHRERENYLTRMKMLAESYLKFIEGEEHDYDKSNRFAPPTLEQEAIKTAPLKNTEPSASLQPEPVQPEPIAQPATPPETGLEELSEIELPVIPMMNTTALDQPEFEPVTGLVKETTDLHPETPLFQPEPVPTALEVKANGETGDDQTPGTSIPDLNAILDRMVASQEDLLRTEDSGESLADPPEVDEALTETASVSRAPILTTVNEPAQTAPAAAPAGPLPQPQAALAAGNGKGEEWSLDKIKQDILANSSPTE